MQSFYFSESQDAMVLQTCHEKYCSGLISLQLDSSIWVTESQDPYNQNCKWITDWAKKAWFWSIEHLCFTIKERKIDLLNTIWFDLSVWEELCFPIHL